MKCVYNINMATINTETKVTVVLGGATPYSEGFVAIALPGAPVIFTFK